MKFRIVPRKTFAQCGSFVEGDSPEDAMANFAANMDSDMNCYFEAVPCISEKKEPWEIVKTASGSDGNPAEEFSSLHLTTGNVIVTDPCYNHDVWCRINSVPVVPGDYTCAVYFSDKGEWGIRVAKIGIYRDSNVREEMMDEENCELIGNIGVDAGLAGIFQEKPDFDDDQWAKFCNDIRTGDAWLVDGKIMRGFFSSSGYGDGAYDVVGHRCHGGAFDGLEIIFLDDEEEEDDE